MVIDKLKAIAAAKVRVARLEKSVARELSRELAGLPAKFGFTEVEAFIGAVEEAAGAKLRRRGRPAKAAAPTRRKRAKITEAIQAKVKKLVKAGKTGTQIAKAVGISLPSVQNIKKAFGLIRERAVKGQKAAAKRKVVRPARKRGPAQEGRKGRAKPKAAPTPEVKPSPSPAPSAEAASA